MNFTLGKVRRKWLGKAGRWLWTLNAEELCAEARRRTGLDELGNPGIERALAILVQSLETEADLHPLGRFLIRSHLRQLLENRLRLIAAWEPVSAAFESSSIDQPIFVVGMPRTGSTFLHELLAEDPENRAPRVWEVMFPIAGRSPGPRDIKRRIGKTEFCLWWFRRFAPGADSVYPVRACTPHECVAIHSSTFLSEEFITTCYVPAYQSFLRSADRTPAYLWEKRFLQYLQMNRPARSWVLKSPDHVFCLEELFSVFPDAVIIQTHRNPLEVLRSTSELTRVLHNLYAWPWDQQKAVLREARALAEATERFIQFRDRHPELADRFIDVKYSELATEPLKPIRRTYAHLDRQLTPEAAVRMRHLAANRSRYRRRRAGHNPEALQAGASAEAGRFKTYCTRFGLSYEGATGV